MIDVASSCLQSSSLLEHQFERELAVSVTSAVGRSSTRNNRVSPAQGVSTMVELLCSAASSFLF